MYFNFVLSTVDMFGSVAYALPKNKSLSSMGVPIKISLKQGIGNHAPPSPQPAIDYYVSPATIQKYIF